MRAASSLLPSTYHVHIIDECRRFNSLFGTFASTNGPPAISLGQGLGTTICKAKLAVEINARRACFATLRSGNNGSTCVDKKWRHTSWPADSGPKLHSVYLQTHRVLNRCFEFCPK